MAEEAQYQIHNTSRDIATKLDRVLAPGNPKKKLMLAGGDIQVLRGRPLTVTEALVRRLAPELVALEQRGFCRVTDVRGVRVNVISLSPVVVEATPPVVVPETAPVEPAASPVDAAPPVVETAPEEPVEAAAPVDETAVPVEEAATKNPNKNRRK